MTNETKTTTPAINALLGSQDYLPVEEIRKMTSVVEDFATRYADDYFEDRATSRRRKNLLTVGVVFLCFSIGVALMIGAILGHPIGQAITGLTALLNAIGVAFLYFTNRK